MLIDDPRPNGGAAAGAAVVAAAAAAAAADKHPSTFLFYHSLSQMISTVIV